MEEFEQRTSRGDFRRNSRRGPRNFSKGFSNPNRKMHKATCSECGNECEVPFEPAPGRDVFCNECFRNRRR